MIKKAKNKEDIKEIFNTYSAGITMDGKLIKLSEPEGFDLWIKKAREADLDDETIYSVATLCSSRSMPFTEKNIEGMIFAIQHNHLSNPLVHWIMTF